MQLSDSILPKFVSKCRLKVSNISVLQVEAAPAPAAGGGRGRDERRRAGAEHAARAAAVRRRGALRAAMAAVRVPLAAPRALPHRRSPGRERGRSVAERRSSCARAVTLDPPPRDAAARPGRSGLGTSPGRRSDRV